MPVAVGAVKGVASHHGRIWTLYLAITPRYVETMKIPMLRGRDFTRSDTATAPLVMIINKTWPIASGKGRTRSG